MIANASTREQHIILISLSTIRIIAERFLRKTHQMNVDYNSFEGFQIDGWPHVVTVRGKVAARDGGFVGEFGRGKFLEREPTHF